MKKTKNKVALVTMAKDEDFYIQEWIDYNLKLGFDAIYIYQNNWYYKNQIPNDKVHFLEWNEDSTYPPSGNVWDWNRQSKCYNTFSRDYCEEYEWALFTDIDCFLTLKKHDNVKDFVSEYDEIEQTQILLNFAWFGDNGITTFDENNTSVLERFTKRWDKPHNFSYYQTVPMCKLHKDLKHSLHFVEGQWIDVDGLISQGVSGPDRLVTYDKAQVNHYYTKTLPEWHLKMKKTRAEGDVGFKNSLDGFALNNFNDVEDLYALNFYKK